MQKKLEKSKGITLITLAVTVIVILILAGVSIRLAIGKNGIISKAEKEKNKLEQEIQDSESKRNTILEELGKETIKENKPYIPEGFIEDKETNLDTGLVIKDPKGNEYVWIEVPNDGTGPDYSNVKGPKDYKNIEQAIKNYTLEYDYMNYTDKWYEDMNHQTDWFKDEMEYNNAKNNMLGSVYQNGGFYIGRYEAGIESKNRTETWDTLEIPVSKPNVYPYNYVTRTQAKVLAERLSKPKYTNTLMFGMQWDLVVKYLEIKGKKQDDGKSWGNFSDIEIKDINPNAKGSNDKGKTYKYDLKRGKPKNTSVVLTTGASEYTKNQNIYDLAGNLWEWTLEYTGMPKTPCALRGANYISEQGGVSSRVNNFTYDSGFYAGFRFALYKNLE